MFVANASACNPTYPQLIQVAIGGGRMSDGTSPEAAEYARLWRK